MFTRDSMIYRCTLEQAQFVAECANLKIETGMPSNPTECLNQFGFVAWWDRQTGGGAGRICWASGLAWVTRHGGYGADLDVTQSMCELFEELKCENTEWRYNRKHPQVYGFSNWEKAPMPWQGKIGKP